MDLTGLNKDQLSAVTRVEGPLLILAGAGSGKTRVITYRIAHMIEDLKISPYSLLAITFTNKAAKEMRERVNSLIGDRAKDMWISTFHSLCVRILRRDIERIGYNRSFVIYDTQDQLSLIKECIKECGLREDSFKPSSVLSAISGAKDKLLNPKAFEARYFNDFRLSKISKVYDLYQRKLKSNNALDFDDLIFKTVELLKTDEFVRDFYQRKFQYVMVDEYQDTNHAQYVLINLLSEMHKNLCVVGDDDQSIYGWRGADIANILDFEKDYKDAFVVKLEQNYRSTEVILDGANSVIKRNLGRKNKKLWTQLKEGEKIKLHKAYDEKDEANFIAREIKKRQEEEDRNLRDFALLYRTNAQSRALEEALIKHSISYKIFGSLKFYDRKEIKDIMAYLRLVQNPLDDLALKRIVNVPKRGIGAKTLEKLEERALVTGESLFGLLHDLSGFDLSTKVKTTLNKFVMMINSFMDMKEILPLTEFVQKVIDNTRYVDELKAEDTDEARGRIENIEEFKSVVMEFMQNSEEKTLEEFLSSVSLVSDLDSIDEEDDFVTLMTLHSAKGLEFPVVFLAGVEEGIFPISRAMLDENQLEEERRLCYVGMTRAKQILYITYANERTLYGRRNHAIASRFISEIDESLFEENAKIEKTKPQSLYDRYKDKYKIGQDDKPKFDGQDDITVGSKIKHPKFGIGMVVAKTGTVYTIAFEGQGIKQIDTTFISLSKL
ncbi:DNA helicase-2 / ATP-dependent DNA helicase PcrA [Acetoanaerobium noterae]|uniref:ATP-dependent DNA helicase n=1 Tax=Acetoanaerobium noterae TaxID=745369 RepID=A0A1T5BSL7_9FIRM|nr:DNA helicase PcrA [Acetoanaerobium noterae]SKB50174.1 DNA helicase-2 / ATP-dependent DNA helicase PcrA [Acetoanaerobium noterae]